MKTSRIILTVVFLATLFIQSCTKENLNDSDNNRGILPAKFGVDIPGSLSNDTKTKSLSLLKSTQTDTLKGNLIYLNLATFIAVGEGASMLVEQIIGAIVVYHIDKPMVLSYVSNDDHRTKNLVVTENAEFAGKTWKYMLAITDALSENEADGGKALQIFWNPSPIDGIALIKPYNCDRDEHINAPNAIFKIAYSEIPTANYDSYMTVEIAGLPMPILDQYAINSLKMHVGKKGNVVDVFGNSDHPNAKFFTQTKGFDWAFVASGYYLENIGVAEVGLPPSKLDESSRKVLLEDYSIKSVLTNQINDWFLEIFKVRPDSSDLANYLQNADAPGYFGNEGFIKAGTSPDTKYDVLTERIKSLAPFNPKSVNELVIEFK
jgi:hypothetical protein